MAQCVITGHKEQGKLDPSCQVHVLYGCAARSFVWMPVRVDRLPTVKIRYCVYQSIWFALFAFLQPVRGRHDTTGPRVVKPDVVLSSYEAFMTDFALLSAVAWESVVVDMRYR